MRRVGLVVACIACVAAVAVVAPALGAPSLKKLAKQLRIVKNDVRGVKAAMIDTIQVRSVESPTVNAAQNTGAVTAACAPGETATGGSAVTVSGSGAVVEFASSRDGQPIPAGEPVAWTAAGFASVDGTRILVQVICAS